MIHYICTGGCNGESDMPGVCTDDMCSDYQLPLKPCECTDGFHEMEIEFEFEGDENEEDEENRY